MEEKERVGHSRASTKSGARALFATLQRLGADVVRLERRFDFLPRDVNTLVVIAPTRPTVDRAEVDALYEWVKGGGRLVYFPTEASRDLLDALGWRLEPGPEGAGRCRGRRGPETYELRVMSQTRLAASPTAVPPPAAMAEDELGWVASRADVGEGWIVVISDPAIASSASLLEGDHAAFLAHLLMEEGGRIAFDEYHHGYIGGQTLAGWLMSTPAGWAVLHGLLALAVFVLARGRRLGPARESREERRRDPKEFLDAFARLCRASEARGLAVELVLADARDAFTRRHGAFDRRTIEREAAKRGGDGPGIADAVDRSRRASKRAVPKAEMMELIRRLDELRSLSR
jgi:hypothetical protein